MKAYKAGIIGCGRVGSLFEEDPLREKPATHAAAFDTHQKTEIAAGCDIDPEKLEKFGARWGLPTTSLYHDYREMLKTVKPDIVSIASWTETHYQIVMDAANTPSVKGIYCEKPIASDLKEAGRMISKCKKRGIKLIVGHERRFDANFVKVKEIVEKEEFGKLKTIVAHALSSAPPKLSRKKYVGGSLFHDGTHLFDLILYYGGPAKWVMGHDKRPHGANYVESTAAGMMMLRNGVTVFVEGGGERDYFKFDVDLQFERGRIMIGNSGLQAFKSGDSKNFKGFRELLPYTLVLPKERVNPFVSIVSELVRAIGSGGEPTSNGAEGRNALELILSFYKSASAGGKKVYIPCRNKNGNGFYGSQR